MKKKSRGLHIVFLIATYACLALACQQDKSPSPNNKITVGSSTAPAAQDPRGASLDKSPMDMSYYPVDYTKEKMVKSTEEPLIARVIYSRPKKDNRVIFGEVVKYGAPWRLGANEATEIEFFKDVRINNKKIDHGRYILYCIPNPGKWTLVLNNNLFTWGLKFDTSRDAYRFDVPVEKTNVPFERFTMEFAKADKGIQLHIAWDSLYASVPILY
jgi:DUF2911 family protein